MHGPALRSEVWNACATEVSLARRVSVSALSTVQHNKFSIHNSEPAVYCVG
jgi:hypothetical protein